LSKKRVHQIDLFKKYPYEVQMEWFLKLIAAGEKTEWGKMYDYPSIRTYHDFAERVPVSDYDALKPYIARLRSGEQNILWPTEIRWYAKSSGTTSDKSKFIPVSQESLEECHFKGAKDLLSLYCFNHPDSQIFDGKAVIMGGSHRITELANSSYYEGDLSAILIQNIPFWADFIRVPSRSIALMSEWESKIEKIAHTTIGHDVTNISGVPSWTLLLLKRILEITGKSNILEVWPNLEVFFHGGVNFRPYRAQFEQLIPSAGMNFMETYNASEGFFGIQDQPGIPEMLLMLDYGIFYEFIPADQFGRSDSKVCTLEEVREGENYAMVITTNAGLWRYLIGDTVVFTCTNPYRIQISGRTKTFINAVGEELIVDNAEKAIQTACLRCQAVVTEYTAAPLFHNNSQNVSHEWLIEFEKPPANLQEFIDIFDEALKSVNSDYEAKRYQDLLLLKPIVHILPPNTFYGWMKKKGKLGGQHKVPRLANDRRYVEDILKMPGEFHRNR
jgi:hypothetical protein